MSAGADVPHLDLLFEDDAHFLKSRAVLRIDSQQAAALQGIFTAPLDGLETGCVFALHVDDARRVVVDAFLVRSEGDVLIDCDGQDVKALWQLLTHAGIAVEDVSDGWRVFAELPNQAAHGGGPTFIRVADPRRRELGARVYRRFEPRESTAWRHEGLYLAHANRLGIPPRAALLRQFGIDPIEAQLHALGALDAEAVAPESAAKLRKELRPQRRLLPFRVEPTGFTLPDMNGASLLAGETVVGVAINRHGLFGLGLVDLGPWRRVLADGVQVRCADEPVLITWPTWIARQSEGRASPAAQRNHAATP